MKRIPTGIAVVIALLLVAFGVCYGIVSGSNEDRVQTMNLLNGSGGLMDVLFYRGADGLNFCKVAERYLDSSDNTLAELKKLSKLLTDESTSLSEKKQADDAIDAAFEAVSVKILSSADERDQLYYQMLKKDLESWSASNAAEAYNQAATKYNSQIAAPFVSLITKLFGIEPCALYE